MQRFAGLLLAATLAACSGSAGNPAEGPGRRSLTVFAAASLMDAFTEMAADFGAAHPGVSVRLNFGSSNALGLQIAAGAQADVFASADQDEMQTLIGASLVAAGSERVLLNNALVVVLAPTNPGDVQSLADLARPGLKLVLAAEEVPAGKYARQVLASLGSLYGTDFSDRALANVVSNEENVRLVLTRIGLGEADAGIVYVSDAAAAADLSTLEIPTEYNVIARYWIAPLLGAPEPDLAAEFVAYALSPEGQATLQKWGFARAEP